MSTHTLVHFSAPLLLALALPCAGPGQPPAARAKKDSVPFQCITAPWNERFHIAGTRYDRPGRQVVWVLKARKDTRVSGYVALITDGDGVELATVKVKFDPDRPTVKAGRRLQAVVRIPASAGAEVARLLIRERP
jgi:hypothetical protein